MITRKIESVSFTLHQPWVKVLWEADGDIGVGHRRLLLPLDRCSGRHAEVDVDVAQKEVEWHGHDENLENEKVPGSFG